jgi:hypothetical protein
MLLEATSKSEDCETTELKVGCQQCSGGRAVRENQNKRRAELRTHRTSDEERRHRGCFVCHPAWRRLSRDWS